MLIVSDEQLSARMLKMLAHSDGATQPVVVVMRPGQLVPSLEIPDDADVALTALPVTDAVKRVDAAGLIETTVDRSVLRQVGLPAVIRCGAFNALLHGADDDAPVDVVGAVLRRSQSLNVVVVAAV